MAVDPKIQRQLQRALQRQRRVAVDLRDLDRTASEVSADALTIADIADVIGNTINSERRRILDHVERRVGLIEAKLRDPHERSRGDHFHRRLVALESAVRALGRKR